MATDPVQTGSKRLNSTLYKLKLILLVFIGMEPNGNVPSARWDGNSQSANPVQFRACYLWVKTANQPIGPKTGELGNNTLVNFF